MEPVVLTATMEVCVPSALGLHLHLPDTVLDCQAPLGMCQAAVQTLFVCA